MFFPTYFYKLKKIKPSQKQMNRDIAFIKMCVALSSLSKCVSHQVACILVRDNRIVSSGINGTTTGYINCDEKFDKRSFDRKKHHEFSTMFEIHAEMNAILNAAKTGISIDGATAYCTLEPCFECSKNLSMSGIKRIVYNKPYDYNKNNIKERDAYLRKVGVSLEKISKTI